MKIALLNLPFDNNYGGNLQRYALAQVLQGLGHQVEHINLCCRYCLPWYKKPFSYGKRMAKKLCGMPTVPVFWERQRERIDKTRNALALRFYERYIPHTPEMRTMSEIRQWCAGRYDAYVVGSDQVWREEMTRQLGIENYFLRFTKRERARRVAYAVSLGVDQFYSPSLSRKLTPLYAHFDAVSVREDSTLRIFEAHGWKHPQASWVLDPTLLLDVDHYRILIARSEASPTILTGKIFCYVLDMNERVMRLIKEQEKALGKESLIMGLSDTDTTSIEQWLCDLQSCEMVITDSFHGTVFSILFNKPFLFVGNKRRGNARVESLLRMLDMPSSVSDLADWRIVNDRLKQMRKSSILFLCHALTSN